ncbi:DKNYY family protein [Acinetobacter marinus]|uniref:DKNYY family protein n=2 Tax=Acinetobacter marinus TaxID=281375 RepID=A0A1G6HQD4_9GAMM|nr:DKNYY family protein [Acinetobacter marinus]
MHKIDINMKNNRSFLNRAAPYLWLIALCLAYYFLHLAIKDKHQQQRLEQEKIKLKAQQYKTLSQANEFCMHFIQHRKNIDPDQRINNPSPYFQGAGYYIYQNAVYFQGDRANHCKIQKIVGADLSSMRTFDNKKTLQLARDKNHVYCLTHPLPDLNPKLAYLIGDGYVSDGTHSYFCSKLPIDMTAERLATLDNFKPFVKLKNSNQVYQLLDSGLISNGTHVYQNGKYLAKLNAHKAHYLNFTGYYNEIYPTLYITDGQTMYLDGTWLDIQYDPTFKILNFQYYTFLINRNNQLLYSHKYPIQTDAKPLPHLISESDHHAISPLLMNHHSIYVYKGHNNQLERIAPHPFQGKLNYLQSDILMDDQHIYFLARNHEKVPFLFRNKHVKKYLEQYAPSLASKLCSSSITLLYQVRNKSNTKWHKIKSIYFKDRKQSYDTIEGSLWENDGDYYFFDEERYNHGKSAMYIAMNPQNFSLLTNTYLSHDQAVDIMESLDLKIPWSKEVVRAKVCSKN